MVRHYNFNENLVNARHHIGRLLRRNLVMRDVVEQSRQAIKNSRETMRMADELLAQRAFDTNKCSENGRSSGTTYIALGSSFHGKWTRQLGAAQAECLRIMAESSAAISAAWAAVREIRMQNVKIQVELRTARD